MSWGRRLLGEGGFLQLLWVRNPERAAWWSTVEEGGIQWLTKTGSRSGSGDPVPAPVPDRYTGPRCYAPGGQTYTPC
jgi:hypothetical protein